MIAQDGRDYFQMGRIGRVADELLANDEIENIIIVGIPYQDRFDRDVNTIPMVNSMPPMFVF